MRYKLVGALAILEMLTLYFKHRNAPPSIKGIAETVHSLPGRTRLFVPSLVGNSDTTADLERSLGSIDAVRAVRANPVTGSVVIRFDASMEPVLLFGAVVHILGLDRQVGPASAPALWREIDAVGKTADNMVRSLSLGLLDVKTLITVLLMGTVAYRLLSGRDRLMLPGTATLGWWMFNLILLRGVQ